MVATARVTALPEASRPSAGQPMRMQVPQARQSLIVGAGLLVQNGTALISSTIGALAVFGLANYAQGVVMGGQNAAASAEASWQKLIDMHVGVLIAYFIVFLVMIGFTFFARSMIFSR